MRYKHDTLLPIGAFKRQGSVVGGRSMRAHGGDSFYAEQSPEDAFRSQYEYALQMAAKGYPRILEDLKASGQIEQFQAKEAETAAINQAATKIAESRQPFDLSQFAGSDYAGAAELANWHLSRGDPHGYAQQFINEAAQGLAQIQAENKKQADLQSQYGNLRFGTGFGQALGYEYGLKNAYGDIYQKYDAQGNLTEYLDKNGKWVNTSTIKPTGFQGFDDNGNPVTGYKHPDFDQEFNNSNKYAPMMSPFREDQGGWLGEGGWGNVARLVVAGLTANPALMASVGVSSSLASAIGNVAISVADGKSFGEALIDGVKSGVISAATAGILEGINADGVENVAANWEDAVNNGSFADAAVNFSDNYIAPVIDSNAWESGGTFTGDAGLTGSDMSFEDLIKSTGLSSTEAASIPTDADFEKYIERYPDLSAAGIDTPQEAIRHYLDYGKNEGRDVSGSGSVTTSPTTTTTATTSTVNSTTGGSMEQDPIAVPLIQQLQAEVSKNEAAGMSRDEAINKSIVDLSVKSDTNRQELANLIFTGDQQLMDALGQTQESLIDVVTGVGSGISTEIQNTKQTLLDQIAKNEASGMTRDVALNAAIQDVSTKLGTTEQNLLNTIGQTKDQLSGQITDVRDDLTGQITGVKDDLTGQITTVGGQVTDLTGQFGDYRTEQEKRQEEEQREKRGKEAVNLLSQMATTTVKTPEVAKIDYMYDIGGDSLFATPKQESLMPSPFEETPEAVEGAMPKYQYYAPGGGYQFAGGGMVAFDEGGDVTQEELEAALRPVTYNPRIAAYGEQRRTQRPEKEMSADDLMLAEIAAGFHPVIGPALSAKDFEEARGENNYLGMGLAGLGMIPVLGGAVKGYNRLVKPALRNRAVEKELVENWGKIPKGQPIPEGYIGGPSPAPRDYSPLKSPDDFYSAPKFQTDYGREFTHDLMHSSPSPNITSFDPRSTLNERARQVTLDPMSHSGGSSPNPLLQGIHSPDDITTFLSGSPEYSSQYLPTKFTVPTPVKEGKIFGNSYTMRTGMPEIKEEYVPGGAMYPVSARLGKVFDPESADAAKVVDSFLDTIQPPKGMDTKTFNKFKERAKESLIYGDTKSVESAPFREFLKNEGFDSFAYIKGSGDNKVKNYGVFEPSRIRGKFAEFNPEFANSPEIMKAEGGLIGDDDLQTIDDLYEMLRSK